MLAAREAGLVAVTMVAAVGALHLGGGGWARLRWPWWQIGCQPNLADGDGGGAGYYSVATWVGVLCRGGDDIGKEMAWWGLLVAAVAVRACGGAGDVHPAAVL